MICGTKEAQNKTITVRKLGQEQQQTEKLEVIVSNFYQMSQAPKI